MAEHSVEFVTNETVRNLAVLASFAEAGNAGVVVLGLVSTGIAYTFASIQDEERSLTGDARSVVMTGSTFGVALRAGIRGAIKLESIDASTTFGSSSGIIYSRTSFAVGGSAFSANLVGVRRICLVLDKSGHGRAACTKSIRSFIVARCTYFTHCCIIFLTNCG